MPYVSLTPVPLALQVLHEPLMVLADSEASRTGGGGPAARSLHCGYAWSAEQQAAALAWTDSAGELQHCRLLELPGLDAGCAAGAAELCGEVLAATLRVRFSSESGLGLRGFSRN